MFADALACGRGACACPSTIREGMTVPLKDAVVEDDVGPASRDDSTCDDIG